MQISPPIPPQDLDYILGRTGPLWEKMRGRRIFLTGGTGFFGSWLLESFLAANSALNLKATVVVLTRSPAKFRTKSPHLAASRALELVEGDVRNFEFPGGAFDYCIHAATETVSSNSLDIFTAIVDGTRRCLEFSQASGVQRFLLTSSGAVYGAQPTELVQVPEEYLGGPDPLRANAAYAEGKRAAETLCSMYGERSHLQCTIARCFAFVGPHLPLDAHFAIGNFLRDAMLGGPIRIQGDGTPMRSYLYAADLAVWLWTILLEAPALRAFNVGSDQGHSIFELAETVANALAPPIAAGSHTDRSHSDRALEIQLAKPAALGSPISRYVPSIARARMELGLDVGIDLRTAIQRTAAWHGMKLK